ncbi:restriction endonuclease [Thalassospira sp. TSL5-1]|uniref:restriction endonuclease n=1 Tax=Thalassospira sp. TSL5-1 TaxID=1544451 RepID=UPI000938C603|nr:restriction endonuclease [Thalassospira sp. TSL5-1]OKH88947.1 AvaIII endonuclease [Thalassospira sp. TSL5-1]
MSFIKHDFTDKIIDILNSYFPGMGEELIEASPLLKYLNIKTKAANRGSKSRASFANIYAIYVLSEDYINNGFENKTDYSRYEGAQYSNLLNRQRQLPFGSKLQNHALNSRLNEEFRKYFPTEEENPIIRDINTNRYWINEKLITPQISRRDFNIARPILDIIQKYVDERMKSFNSFMEECRKVLEITNKDDNSAIEFIINLLRPNVDARIFEIVSYAILKQYYINHKIYWGFEKYDLKEEEIKLYKTGRTNANDGGIDFVMKPLGRFFQVTETVDAGKYFLDIDKVQRFPITFVVKTNERPETIRERIKLQASMKYGIERIVNRYMICIEEIINIPRLIECFDEVLLREQQRYVFNEIVLQSRLEFNMEEE